MLFHRSGISEQRVCNSRQPRRKRRSLFGHSVIVKITYNLSKDDTADVCTNEMILRAQEDVTGSQVVEISRSPWLESMLDSPADGTMLKTEDLANDLRMDLTEVGVLQWAGSKSGAEALTSEQMMTGVGERSSRIVVSALLQRNSVNTTCGRGYGSPGINRQRHRQ